LNKKKYKGRINKLLVEQANQEQKVVQKIQKTGLCTVGRLKSRNTLTPEVTQSYPLR